MKRLLFLSIVAAFALLSLFVTLPRPVAPATASPVVPPSTATAEVVRPTPPATATVAVVPTAAPTAEPPVVVKPNDPPAQPPAQTAPKADASLEQARLLRVELRLLVYHGLRVNINSYGVYSVRDERGNFIDATPEQRILISEATATWR